MSSDGDHLERRLTMTERVRQPMPKNEDRQRCIQECLNCHSICLTTMTYCLQKGGAHAEVAHVQLLLDCAEICQTSANFMLRGSDQHRRTCAACAAICEVCAAACAQMSDDPPMQNCAEACRRCAESCRRMAMVA
jgi:hypothetical protein